MRNKLTQRNPFGIINQGKSQRALERWGTSNEVDMDF
jgi:hypothetical protein